MTVVDDGQPSEIGKRIAELRRATDPEPELEPADRPNRTAPVTAGETRSHPYLSIVARFRNDVRDSELDSTAKLVAFALSTYMTHEGETGHDWQHRSPSIITLARGASLSTKTKSSTAVVAALARLERTGLLEVERRLGAQGHRYRAIPRPDVGIGGYPRGGVDIGGIPRPDVDLIPRPDVEIGFPRPDVEIVGDSHAQTERFPRPGVGESKEQSDAAATAHDLREALDQLGVTDPLRQIALTGDHDRGLACARAALARGKRNPAGLFRTLLEKGEWPTPHTPPPPSPPCPDCGVGAGHHEAECRSGVVHPAELAGTREAPRAEEGQL